MLHENGVPEHELKVSFTPQACIYVMFSGIQSSSQVLPTLHIALEAKLCKFVGVQVKLFVTLKAYLVSEPVNV